MREISIEYAHIYTNSEISSEHELSLKILDQFDVVGKSLVVLIDDYSFPDPTFNYGEFIKWLTDHGHEPDVVMRESQLIPQCDEVLALLTNSELKVEIVEYIKNKKKYPCSLFIATWYLLRLGKLSHPNFSEFDYSRSLINILPESFKPFEDKAIEIIQNTNYSELVSKIENNYIEGRLIA